MRARVAIGVGGLLAACLTAAIWGGAFAPRPGQDQTCARLSPPWATAQCYHHRR